MAGADRNFVAVGGVVGDNIEVAVRAGENESIVAAAANHGIVAGAADNDVGICIAVDLDIAGAGAGVDSYEFGIICGVENCVGVG